MKTPRRYTRHVSDHTGPDMSPDVPNVLASRYASDQLRALWNPVGRVVAERVVVEQGLAEGERVVTRGQHFLRPGDAVTVAEE